MIKRGKKGQFYLAAAIIIVMVVFGLAAVNNYARVESRETGIFDLRSELGLEGAKVMDFALYSKKSSDDTSKLIENWTEMYISGKEEQEIENWLFVYGNPKVGITVLAFTMDSTGTISVVDGNTAISTDVERYKRTTTLYYGDYVDIVLGNFTYRFDTTADQNFAFLINKGGYVADSRLTGASVSEIDSRGTNKKDD